MKFLKKLLLIYIALLSICAPLAAETLTTLAVLDLRAGSKDVTSEAQTVTEIIGTAMNNTGKYTLVERSAIGKILKEQALQQTGITDGQAAKIGKLLGAQKVLIGSLSRLGKSYIIDGKIVDVEKGSVDFSETVKTKTADDLPDAAREFADHIDKKIIEAAGPAPKTHGGAIWRSVLLPGWGQIYAERSTKGKIFIGTWLLSLGAVGVTYSKLQQDRKAYDSSVQTGLYGSFLYQPNLTRLTYMQSADKLSNSIHSANQANAAGAFLAVVFIANLIDIYFWGTPPSTEKKSGGRAMLDYKLESGQYASDAPGRLYTIGYQINF